MDDKNSFKIIDDVSIHQDFIKILKMDSFREMDSLSEKLFGGKKKASILPNFEVDVASQGQEGGELIERAMKQGSPYALAFVDIRMPLGWDGVETIKHILALSPITNLNVTCRYVTCRS